MTRPDEVSGKGKAMAQSAVFVAIESDGPRWIVKADTLPPTTYAPSTTP
ncbi:hypothetical protein ACGFXB_44450 [Streptomyces canus]